MAKKKDEAPPPPTTGKFEVTGGGHMHGDTYYPKGSVIESDQPLDKKFVNVFKRLPDDAEPTLPQSINPDDLPKGVQVSSPAITPGTEDAGVDPAKDKKPVNPAWEKEAPGEDATEAFPAAEGAGVAVFQKDDGTFVVRSDDGDQEFEDSDAVSAHLDSLAGEDSDEPKKGKAKKGKK